MSLNRSSAPNDPRCYYCHRSVPAQTRMRAYPNGRDRWPVGVMIVVCGTDCPEVPDGYTVGTKTEIMEALGRMAEPRRPPQWPRRRPAWPT